MDQWHCKPTLKQLSSLSALNFKSIADLNDDITENELAQCY